jgi:hypothetical protein
MNEQETKVTHTHKLDKSVMKVLWVFAIALLLNALPDNSLISSAMAELDRYDISYCWDGATLKKQSNGDYKIKTYC